ncbi:MAG: replicative DNA helicase [Thermodesulfobacteriota bacterium]
MNRVPPNNLAAETSILGAALISEDTVPNCLEVGLLDTDFYREAHRIIWRTMVGLFDRNEPIDLVSVASALGKKDLDSVGGPAYLSQLMDSVGTGARAKHHAKLVRDCATRRRLLLAGRVITEEAFRDDLTLEEHLDNAEHKIMEIRDGRGVDRSAIPAGGEPLKAALRGIEERHKNGGPLMGVRTGLVDLDHMTSGLTPPDLWIVAGRPSMGKTALALNIAEAAAVVSRDGTAFFSLEMSLDQVEQRLLASIGRVDLQKIRTGRGMTDQDWDKLATAAVKLQGAPLFIDDTPALSVLELKARARRIKARLRSEGNDLRLVLVDYLQLMVSRDHETREQEISSISRSLKAMAKEFGIPVVALSQLSRKVEDRGDRRPRLSDLRESGAIEQDADAVLFVFREYQYTRRPGDEHKAELILDKQRQGPTGVVQVHWQGELSRFTNALQEENHGS